jgi:hypothetical protein
MASRTNVPMLTIDVFTIIMGKNPTTKTHQKKAKDTLNDHMPQRTTAKTSHSTRIQVPRVALVSELVQVPALSFWGARLGVNSYLLPRKYPRTTHSQALLRRTADRQ